MSKITISFILLLAIMFVGKSNCGVTIMTNGITSSGRFNIYEKDGIFHCGSLTCPSGSRCIITQKTNPNNTAELITREKCFDNDDNLINQHELIEASDPNNIINQRIETGSGGSYVYNPELVQKELENVHKTVTNTLQSVHDNLQNMFSAPLVPDINFGDSFPFGPKNSPFGPGFPFSNNNNDNNGRREFVPLDNEQDNDKNYDPHLGYEVSQHNNQNNYKKNTREDIDSDEEVNVRV